jgi:hypothetical protein
MGVCAASCSDMVQDGDETGTDCGGSCPGCAPGDPCLVDKDCASKLCGGVTCLAPTCTDGVQNGDESDVDCGGSKCKGCPDGDHCTAGSDCLGAGCAGGVCAPVLLVSQVRSQGTNGYDDDFIELYNPGVQSLTMDATWGIVTMSANGGCMAPATVYAGTGLVIPPHGHMLVVGPAYNQAPSPDAMLTGPPGKRSIDDAGAVWVSHGTKRTDTLCYYFDPTSQSTLGNPCSIPYMCPGPPVNNFPHHGPVDNFDISLERLPGGDMGNAQDTLMNANDFQQIGPADPHDLATPPEPPLPPPP